MSSQIAQFILMLSEVHRDSLSLFHFARKPRSNDERSTMPVTAFVYGFFLYNSLYSIDWESTLSSDKITYHPDDKSEGFKQQQFEDFIRKLAEADPAAVRRSFATLGSIGEDASWTEVVPDPSISVVDGSEFFLRLNQLSGFVRGSNEEVASNLGRIFSRIQSCRLFVYQVRNNVFHGTKSLGQIWDKKQLKRIETYQKFLQCLVSCFFELARSEPSFKFG
jgi:hypothetical protein